MSIQKTAPAHDPVLRASPLFKALSELEFNAVSAFLEPRKVIEGEVIFREGAAGEELYILVSGRVGASVSQPDGSQRSMFEIVPGDFFGEMSVIANETRSASLTARENTELLALHAIDFYRIIYEHPMIGVKMLKAIGKVQSSWLDETSRNLSDLLRWGETARRRAVSDDLTGLYNRSFLEESVKDRFARGSFELRCASFLMMDLDRFHEVNQRFGTLAGDQLLIATSDVLRSIVRSEDICARLSGDEFAMFLPDTDPEEAISIAERVRQTLAVRKIPIPNTVISTTGSPGQKPVQDQPSSTGKANQTEVVINISIGAACAPIHADSWEKLYLCADAVLLRAKENGRNRVEIAG